jgi:excisionase family DNA binding protein
MGLSESESSVVHLVVDNSRSHLPRLSYRPDEAADMLGLSRRSVDRLIASGQLRSIKMLRARLIPAASIESFLASQETTAKAA